MWNLMSKTDWLWYGDQNTKYFHCRAMERNVKNFILGLENEQEDWIEGEEQIGEMLARYYSNLFSTANPTKLDPVLNRVEPRVTDSMNIELLRPFMVKEEQLALKKMKPDTA